LIVLVQGLEIAYVAQSLDLLIAKPNTVVEVTQPNHRVVVFDRPVALELESMADCLIITITFLVVGEASSKVSRNETNRRIAILDANRNSSFVPCHTRHASLRFVSKEPEISPYVIAYLL
jgi:hypothetical protein